MLFLPQSPVLDGMPHGSGGKDLSGVVTKSTRLRHDLQLELAEVYARRQAVLDAIDLVPPSQGLVLRYRYIHIDLEKFRLCPWEEVAEKTGYCYSRVLQIHREGLKSLHEIVTGGG